MSNSMTESLKRLPIFAACSDRDLEAVARLSTTLDVASGKVLATEGLPGQEFVVIRAGTVKVSRDGTDLAELGPGDYFGEISLMDGGPRTATVTAITPVTIEVVERRDFDSLLETVPGLAQRIMIGLAQRLREKTDRF
ncbi:MAG TPA: cyclic nucleotide-binding domain-containing protein [Frankiaceae bacterium]|nr:cyclic nucleotide-binding domain-containing protein [Frankiaceae bacterium]